MPSKCKNYILQPRLTNSINNSSRMSEWVKLTVVFCLT